ncbi:MAG: peptidylprolyl isomerase [Calditrichia bacterium]
MHFLISGLLRQPFLLTRKMKHFTFLIILLLLSGCSREPQPDSPIVARVKDQIITLRQVEISQALEPQFSQRTPLREVRESQVDHLIRKSYYYLTARELHLEDEAALQPKLEYIRRQEIINGYLHQEIIDSVKVTAAELREGLRNYKEELHVRQIFIPDNQKAQQVLQSVHTTSFNEVYEHHAGMDSSRISAVDLGMITFGILEPEIESAAFELSAGESSGLVRSGYGYHIIQVVERQENRSSQRLSPLYRRSHVSDIILRRKADDKIRQALEKLADDRKIQVNNRIMQVLQKAVVEAMGENYLTPEITKPPIFDRELNEMQLQLKDVLNETLVRFGEREISVSGFLQRMKQMPPGRRPWLPTRLRIAQAVIDMIRNDLLYQAALSSGMNRNERIEQEIHRQTKNFLAEEVDRRLNDSIYRTRNLETWRKIRETYLEVRKRYPAEIKKERLFADVAAPDSIMVDAPLPLHLKNRYVW